MNKIGSYGIFQKNYYKNTIQNKNEKEKTNKLNDIDEKNSQVQLSDEAKQLLKELQKSYGNMDFMVADYKTDEEAETYLSRGTKEYSVLIEPKVLEEMAKNKKSKEKYVGMINDATTQLNNMKEQLGDNKEEVKHLGISIDNNGNLSYFADLEKLGENQKERIEKSKEAKKEKAEKEEIKKEEAKKQEILREEKIKKTKVKANSIKELIEKIKNVNWDKIQPEMINQNINKFDYSI